MYTRKTATAQFEGAPFCGRHDPITVYRNKPSAFQRLPGPYSTLPGRVGVIALFSKYDLTVDDDVEDAFGVLMRLRVRGSVFDPGWIEDGDIRLQARPQHTTSGQSESRSRNAVILRTASWSVSGCFSRTYTPSTRTNVP